MGSPQQQSQQQLQANRQPPAQLDMQAVALAQKYFDIRDRHLSLKGPWSESLQDLASQCNAIITRAGHFDSFAPPAWFETRPAVQWLPGAPAGPTGGVRGRGDSTLTRGTIPTTPFITEALRVAQGMRDALVSEHGNDYKAIVDTATGQCAPSDVGVLTAQTEKVADIKREVQGVLNTLPAGGQARNMAAQRILNQAIAEKNTPLLYCLLSGPMDTYWLATGDVSVATLQRIYAQATAKANAALQQPNPPAVELVVLQDGPYALDGLVDAAVAYFDYELAQTRAYLTR
jgi:hypothetical protein